MRINTVEDGKRTASSAFRNAIRRNGLFILLFILLDVAVILCYFNAPSASLDSALVGVAREPSAYCAFAEIGSNNTRYKVVMEDGLDELVSALNRGALDAAILPVQCLDQLDPDEFVVMAVTSSLNLVAVGNGAAVYGLYDLNGRSVTMPESLRDSREMRMLNFLISKTDTDIHIVYQDDETIRQSVPESRDEILLLPPEQCADLLLRNPVYKSCFALASQWEALLGSPPPAGSCFVARKADAEKKASGMSDFLSGMKASIAFLNSKHKKAATLIAASGLNQDAVFVWKVLPYCAFRYLDGEEMAQSLNLL
ncbi:MAG TPA: hypothetical protein PKE04_07550 [Clostridia bacterium]|nr:hypothetical protein [Clostridia bacterium]